MNRHLALHFALRADDGFEVGILRGDIVVRRAGWLARMLRDACPRWLREVLLVGERWGPGARSGWGGQFEPSRCNGRGSRWPSPVGVTELEDAAVIGFGVQRLVGGLLGAVAAWLLEQNL